VVATKRLNTKGTKATKKGAKNTKKDHFSSCPSPFFVRFAFFVNFVSGLTLGAADRENLLRKTRF